MSAPMIHRSYHAPIPVSRRRVAPPVSGGGDPTGRGAAPGGTHDTALRGPRDTRLPAPRHSRGTECGGGARPRRQQRPQPSAVRGTDRAVARRRSAAGILVGAALAGLVWVFALVGGDYEAASAPEPVATSVVHVRGGETLNSVAARVAPEVPRQAVINQLRALNGMTTTALSVGQALVVPVYR